VRERDNRDRYHATEGANRRTMLYVLTICVSLLSGGCAPNTVAFSSALSCEAARLALRSEFSWARCERRSASTLFDDMDVVEPEPFEDGPAIPAR
jgi:hypothetical protein